MRPVPASAVCRSLAFGLRYAGGNHGSFVASLLPGAWEAQMLHAFDGPRQGGVDFRPINCFPSLGTLPL